MSIDIYNHVSCVGTSKIKSAYCAEMSTALDINYTRYQIPSATMLVSDIRSVFLAVQSGEAFSLVPVTAGNWTTEAGNILKLLNQDPANLALHNRIVVIPMSALNLCFTGVAGTNVPNKRALWLKRSESTKMYDYLAITSIDYFAPYYSILEYPNVQFINGFSDSFTNLTSAHIGMRVDFDGQFVGAINDVTGVTTLQLDTAYTSTGPSRAFVYAQGTLDFALDVNGAPGTWTRHLSIPVIDTDIPTKVWMRDYKTVSASITTYANNAIRILGTEFIL